MKRFGLICNSSALSLVWLRKACISAEPLRCSLLRVKLDSCNGIVANAVFMKSRFLAALNILMVSLVVPY